MKEKIRVAQLGCNGVAHCHARAHGVTGNTELVAVCDTVEERAAEFAQKYKVKDYTTKARELFTRDDIDMIDIVTPDATHAPLAIAAANSGKHVLIEKPIATSVEDANGIIDAATKNKVKMMCAQSYRWLPKIAAFADAVFQGQIGKLVFLRIWGGCSRFWSADGYPKGEADYLMSHNAMHWMDITTWLIGEYPTSVYTLGHPGEDDVPLWEYFVANLGFPSGAMAAYEDNRIIQPQTGYPTIGTGMYAIGEKGSLSLEATGGLAVSMYNKDGMCFPGSHVYAAECDDNFAGEIWHLADCILNDSSPSISLEHSKKVLTAVLAASESFRIASPVEVRYE